MTVDHFNAREIPLVAGFQRGYRAWWLADVPTLRSTSITAHRWTAGQNEAFCETLRQMEKEARGELPRMMCRQAQHLGACQVCERFWFQQLEQLRDHATPSKDCKACNNCGFYAFNDMDEYAKHKLRYVTTPESETVVGSIKATGRVVLGTAGFRARYAVIEALVGNENDESMRQVAAAYNVPLVPDVQTLIKEFPPSPPIAGSSNIPPLPYPYADEDFLVQHFYQAPPVPGTAMWAWQPGRFQPAASWQQLSQFMNPPPQKEE